MKIKQFICSALTLAVLGSCNSSFNTPFPAYNPQNAYKSYAQKLNPIRIQQRLFSFQNTPKRIEQLVSQERIQDNMAALTGVRSISKDSNTIIPERGTRNGRALTRTFLATYLESLGYEVEKHEYRRHGINIITKLMADEPTDEYIVVGAHMDSVRNAGADDNGTGSTAVLEAATILPQLEGRKVNIIFAWFDEEELGLIGSRYLAKAYKKQKLNITSMHNVDMLGWDGDGDKVIEVARPHGILWDYYNMVNQTHGLNLPLERTSTRYSDHVSFSNAGYDSLMLIEEYTTRDMTPHYHRKSDQYKTINFEYLTRGTKLLIAAVSDLARKVPAPKGIKFIPHDRFPSRDRDFHKHGSDIEPFHHH